MDPHPSKQAKIDKPAHISFDANTASTVTVEIPVDSETQGYSVLTYVIAVVEGSSISADQGLTAALNTALASRTTDGCDCVATSGNAYDCSACEEGGAFSTAESITSLQGGYDLLSTDGSGGSPVSVFAPDDSEREGANFWSDFTGGKQIRSVLRTDSYTDMAAVVAIIVVFTSLCGCFSRCITEQGELTPPALGTTGTSTDIYDNGEESAMGLNIGAQSPVNRKQQWGGTSEHKMAVTASSPTPGTTPAPARATWEEGKG